MGWWCFKGDEMDNDKNTVLSHLYGVSGLVPGLIGLVYLVKTDAPWQEYALLASGWITAIFYGVMLVRCFSQARFDGEVIGELRERVKSLEKEHGHKVKSLEKELDQKNGLANYLSGLLMNGSGKPRRSNTDKKSISSIQLEEQS
jgi:hypothetical protein